MVRNLVVAVACAVVAVCASRADDPDPVKEKLFAAKVAYDADIKQFRKAADEWFDKREEAARKAGDKKAVDQIKEEREAFDESGGTLPKSAPAALKGKHDRAAKALESAYTQAARDYRKAKQDAEAGAVEAEWAGLALAGKGAIDLLALVDPKAHAVLGEWKRDGKALVGVNPKFPGVLQLPYQPGEEYDLEVTFRRLSGEEYFALQMVAGGRRFNAAVDTWPSRGYLSGFGDIGGKGVLDNGTGAKGQLLKTDKDCTVACSVRSGKIDLSVNGKLVTSYKGEFTRFSIHPDFKVPDEKALAIQIGYATPFKIDRLVVTPVKGKGTVLK